MKYLRIDEALVKVSEIEYIDNIEVFLGENSFDHSETLGMLYPKLPLHFFYFPNNDIIVNMNMIKSCDVEDDELSFVVGTQRFSLTEDEDLKLYAELAEKLGIEDNLLNELLAELSLFTVEIDEPEDDLEEELDLDSESLEPSLESTNPLESSSTKDASGIKDKKKKSILSKFF